MIGSRRSAAGASLAAVALCATAVRAAEPPAPAPAAPAETVVVTANRLTVETLIDRKVYSVATDVQSTFGTVSDILTAIPSVDVDSEGTVSLRGDSNVLILVDGKPSALFAGASAGDNLQSIPAKDIERIEVISNPPAQFKAEGTAGVINIITRRKHPEGVAGSLQASLGSGGRYVFGTSIGYKSGPLTLSFNASFRQDYRNRLIESQLLAPDPITGQPTDSQSSIDERLRRVVPPVGFSAEYALDEQRSISASFLRSSRAGLRTYTEINDTLVPPASVTGSTERLSAGHDREVDYDAKLGLSQKFARPGESLEFLLHRTLSHEVEHYDYTNESFIPPAATFYNNLGFHEDHGTSEFSIDYVLPFSKADNLKLGYDFEQDAYDYGAAGYNIDPVTALPVLNPNLTDAFRFRQQVDALYATWQASAGAWNVQAGARGEFTRTDARQLIEGVTSVGDYTRLYPSLHVDRALSDSSTVSFGASRRITRPPPSALDPYVDTEYTPNLRAGNPALRPQYTQSYELGYAFEAQARTLSVTGYYRLNKDSVTTVTEDLGNGVSLSTSTNLPSNNSAGLEMTATGVFARRLTYSVDANLFYSQIDASALGFPGLKSTSGVNAKIKLDYRPTAADSAQATLTRTDKRLTPQGYVDAIDIVNLGYRRRLNRDLSAVVTVSDAFNGQRYRRVAVTPAFTQDYQRNVRGRIAYVGVIYSFGSRKERQANFDYDE